MNRITRLVAVLALAAVFALASSVGGIVQPIINDALNHLSSTAKRSLVVGLVAVVICLFAAWRHRHKRDSDARNPRT